MEPGQMTSNGTKHSLNCNSTHSQCNNLNNASDFFPTNVHTGSFSHVLNESNWNGPMSH